MRRVLLTGGSGFVGACLARRLLCDGHEVNLLLRDEHQPWRLTEILRELRVHLVRLDDFDSVLRCVRAVRPEWIFHLAAYGASSHQQNLATMLSTNVVGAASLVQAAVQVGVEAFVNTGSSSEYGFKDHAPAEDEPIEPNSHYAVTKASATLLCRHAANRSGMRIPTLRLYSVYGPYEEPTRLIPTLIRFGEKGELPPLVDPRVARDFVFVDDVCEAYVRAASRPMSDPGIILNIGSGTQTTIEQVVSTTIDVFGLRAQPKWGSMDNRSWDTVVWCCSPGRAAREIGWQATTVFEDGFRRTREWLASSSLRWKYLGPSPHD